MRNAARWILLTHDGHVALAVVYWIAAAVSIITYTIMRSPVYGLGQAALFAGGFFWIRWCWNKVSRFET